MKKRRDLIDYNVLLKDNSVRITKESEELFFEIRNEVTTDVAEAVAIMINMDIKELWGIELNHTSDVDPEKCLYWLSGGNKEWLLLDHYNRPWVDCYLDFQEEFGFMIIEIVKNSKTLGDIKDEFIRYLNLPILYDFALSRNFIR